MGTSTPAIGARLRITGGSHRGEIATVLSVREPHPNDPIVTIKSDTGMLAHWRPAWGLRGMPTTEALPNVAH